MLSAEDAAAKSRSTIEIGGSSPAAVSTSRSRASARTAPFDPVPRLTGIRLNGWLSRPALRFDDKPARGVLRRQITYRLVRLSDGPDELHSREIMRLDRGDDIEIVSDGGSVLQVRTTTGQVGWIPGISILG